MLRKFSQTILILVFILFSFCIYLSVYGINTDKFNSIISQKISERDNDFDIKLNKIKIFLDLGKLKLEAKTKNPIIFYKKSKIELKSISTSLPLFSILNQEVKLENLKFTTKKKQNKGFNRIWQKFTKYSSTIYFKKNSKVREYFIRSKNKLY